MNGYNPDVLSCIANLSNDEVFTPPQLANKMLDLLPEELWHDSKATFLDPGCKTGVFLREIAKRLMVGLKNVFPDEQERANHIFSKQLYGIPITQLTSLLSRRSVYCSKTANGKYSVCGTFNDEQGNLRFKPMQHVWSKNGNCLFCGASKEVYDRSNDSESYAYQFIHTNNPEEIYNMKFDVIIGNPPYQLNDGGGTGSSAKPIYHKFIQQAKKLNPRYLSMIIPARWYSGGKGLDEFRNEMLNDNRIKILVDYPDSRQCFPGVDIAGGVCYFLWEKEYSGECTIRSEFNNNVYESKRNLNTYETFVRNNIAIEIINKVKNLKEQTFDSIVSSRMPFGISTTIELKTEGEIRVETSNGIKFINFEDVTSGTALIDKWKILLSKASNDHGGQPDKEGKRKIFSRVEIMPPNTICTESYLSIGRFSSETDAKNTIQYLKTKFVRFLVSTILLTQNITKSSFIFVPLQDFSKSWTDVELYKKYDLTEEEVAFIESMIRPME